MAERMTIRKALKAAREWIAQAPDYSPGLPIFEVDDGSRLFPRNVRCEDGSQLLGVYEICRVFSGFSGTPDRIYRA